MTYTLQETTDSVMLIINNNYGFYSVMQQAFQDRYDGRLTGEKYKRRIRLLVEDATGYTKITELKGVKAATGKELHNAVIAAVEEEYVEFKRFKQGETK